MRNRKEERRAVLVDFHVIPGVQYHCTLLCVKRDRESSFTAVSDWPLAAAAWAWVQISKS